MSHEQEQLNRKTGMSNAATATAPPASKSMVSKGFGWFKSNLVTALLVIVGVVVLMLFVGLPLWNWVTGDSRQEQEQTCLPVSDNKVRRCVIGEKPTMFTTERLEYSRYLEFCVGKPADGEYQSKQTGSKTWLIWSTKGPLPIEYKLLEGSCPNKF
jgi:hypothetical protein